MVRKKFRGTINDRQSSDVDNNKTGGYKNADSSQALLRHIHAMN